MIDTHCHFFDEAFDGDLDDCIKRCKENNIEKVMIVGFSYKTNRLAQKLAQKYDFLYPTAGVHPEECNNEYLSQFNELKEFIKNNKIYAIGECGLDYHWSKEFKEEQKILFRLQCELAIEKNLPIIIHSRDADQDTFDIVKSFNGKLKGVMHCYGGSLEMAKEYVKLGMYISLGGPLTFKNAKEPKRVCDGIPLDYLLIETDSPYLAPDPYRGKRNESSYVRFVCQKMAEIKNLTIEEVDRITTNNAIKLFNI
jgi:TatD DNase family protein